jgi:hypothetical protein
MARRAQQKTKPDTKPAAVAKQPEYGRIPDACLTFGLSRTGIYRLANAGEVRLLKLAGRTLVDYGSVRAYLAALPAAEIHLNRSA